MAKKELIEEAKELGIEVNPEDTVKVIQEMIDAKRKELSSAGAPGVEAGKKAEGAVVPGPVVSGPKWIKVTAEELAKLQSEGKLKGYRPDTKEALIK